LRNLLKTITLRSDMTNADRSESAATRSHNRIAAIMMHTDRYSFRGTSRLAADTGLSKSTISHLVRGKSSPLYITVERVVKALVDQLGRPLNHQEVVSATGRYPTPSVCALVGCRGCLPDRAFSSEGELLEEMRQVTPGNWSGDVAEFRRPVHAQQAEGGR
jgi:DNA-binding phage protein